MANSSALKTLAALALCACVGTTSADRLHDAGQPDAGQPDTGQPDAGQPDAGQPDAGQPDADAGQGDAGEVDAGATASVALDADTLGVHPGGQATLTWSSLGTTACATSWSATGLSGSFRTPPLNTDTTFTVTCESPNGPLSQQVTIRVGASLDVAGKIGAFTIRQSVPLVESAETPVSLAWLNSVPDGGLPRVESRGGHLWAGGERLRLYGLNIPLASSMPEKADADRVVPNLRKQGFNALRIISVDTRLSVPNTYSVTFRQQGFLNTDAGINATALDRFDYFVALAEKNGLYVQFVLTQGRAAYGLDCSKLNLCRGIDMYLPELIAAQKQFAAEWLNHVNPYTGVARRQKVDEPQQVAHRALERRHRRPVGPHHPNVHQPLAHRLAVPDDLHHRPVGPQRAEPGHRQQHPRQRRKTEQGLERVGHRQGENEIPNDADRKEQGGVDEVGQGPKPDAGDRQTHRDALRRGDLDLVGVGRRRHDLARSKTAPKKPSVPWR